MIKVLFIGDIMGKIGREAIKQILPELKSEIKPDLVIANAENLAHGKGVTEESLKEMMAAGIDWFTGGDHAFSNPASIKLYDSLPLLRPANYARVAPGQGYAIINLGEHKIALINLIGRVYMSKNHDCPFYQADEILSKVVKNNLSAIIIDIHAETTSEKVALRHYLDGRISALIGTHTHVMTADQEITGQGAAYITDVGMTGFRDGVIGLDKANIIKTFREQIKYPHVLPECGRAIFNAILIKVDHTTKKATNIQPITKFIEIK